MGFKRETEKAFQARVLELARLHGWVAYHVPDSRRCTSAGFPDLVLAWACGPRTRLLVAELKVGENKTTPEQGEWLWIFRNEGVPTYIWRPDDWDEIVAVLSRKLPARV